MFYMYTNWLDDDTNAEDKIKKWRPILAWNRGSISLRRFLLMRDHA